MQALILAGGFGSRLMPVVNDRPKIMADIDGKPFLELLIRYLQKQNVNEIVLALGYLSEYIKNYFQDGKQYGVNIKYSVESFPLGTGGAIINAEKLLKKEFIVLNGDTFLDVDFNKISEFHKHNKADITVMVTKKGEKTGRGLVGIDDHFRMISFQDGQEVAKNNKSYTNAGIYLMNKKLCSFIKKDEKISLEKEIFPSIVSKIKMFALISENEYIDIGIPERYHKAQTLLNPLLYG